MQLQPGTYAIADPIYIFDGISEKLSPNIREKLKYENIPRAGFTFEVSGYTIFAFKSGVVNNCCKCARHPIRIMFAPYDVYTNGKISRAVSSTGVLLIVPISFITAHCNSYTKWLFNCKFYYNVVITTIHVRTVSAIHIKLSGKNCGAIRIGKTILMICNNEHEISIVLSKYSTEVPKFPLFHTYSMSTMCKISYYLSNKNGETFITDNYDPIIRILITTQQTFNDNFDLMTNCYNFLESTKDSLDFTDATIFDILISQMISYEISYNDCMFDID
jgi:hypothetical protein